MENVKVCPHCGGTQFMAHIKRGCLVECDGMDANGNPTFKVIKEGAKNKYELEILRCATCKADVTEADLIGGVPCKNCGKLFAPTSLDENGNCEVCAMLLANPELQNASQSDLLRLLARAMKGVKSDTNLVEQKQDQASQVEVDLNNTEDAPEQQEEEPSAADAILNGNTPSDAATPKTRKRRTVKRATDQAPEAQPVDNTSNPLIPDLSQATEELAQSQEAPFPDVEGMPDIPPQPAEPPAELPNPVGSGFQMFENGDDDEPF